MNYYRKCMTTYLKEGIINCNIFVLLLMFMSSKHNSTCKSFNLISSKINLQPKAIYLYVLFLEDLGLLIIDKTSNPWTYVVDYDKVVWEKIRKNPQLYIKQYKSLDYNSKAPFSTRASQVRNKLFKSVRERLPKGYRTFSVKEGQLSLLTGIADSIDIIAYTDWFKKKHLGIDIFSFNLGIFLHSKMLKEYKRLYERKEKYEVKIVEDTGEINDDDLDEVFKELK